MSWRAAIGSIRAACSAGTRPRDRRHQRNRRRDQQHAPVDGRNHGDRKRQQRTEPEGPSTRKGQHRSECDDDTHDAACHHHTAEGTDGEQQDRFRQHLSCTRCARPAPIATRIAISRRRAAPARQQDAREAGAGNRQYVSDTNSVTSTTTPPNGSEVAGNVGGPRLVAAHVACSGRDTPLERAANRLDLRCRLRHRHAWLPRPRTSTVGTSRRRRCDESGGAGSKESTRRSQPGWSRGRRRPPRRRSRTAGRRSARTVR